MFLPVIMSGGSGERLWPASREFFPKPFITLPDGQSLIQKAFLRAAAQENVAEVLTVTNREHYFKTRSEYSALGHPDLRASYILEPMGRNTAPAMAMAASYAAACYGDDTVVLVLSADQLIEDEDTFHQAVLEARTLAEQGHLVTFGITPNRPETGYGYIEMGEAPFAGTAHGYPVARFVEKPDSETAERYILDGKHLWNAGIFCFKAGVFLHEMQRYAPAVMKALTHATPSDWSQAYISYVELSDTAFAAVPSISVDYALMEKSDNVAVVACNIGWNDVGCWSAMSHLVPADLDGNRIIGDALTHDAKDCYIQAGDRMVGAVGVRDLIIIDTPDALLVANRASSQQVKQIVGQLKKRGHETSRQHSTVFRPWGSYTVLQESPGYKIKRIEVLPGQKLSLQTHTHRSEHWVVVSGHAHVQKGAEMLELHPSESTYIPAGITHRLENKGPDVLSIVEVQCGGYLGEDDIVRHDDHYGRTGREAVA